MNKIHFTPKDILQKDFKQKMRGYDPTDVDSFLDMVIRDYETFDKTTRQLQSENEALRNKVDELSKASASQPNNIASAPVSHNDQMGADVNSEQPSQNGLNNQAYLNIMKRLSRLEDRVFGSPMNNGHDSHRL